MFKSSFVSAFQLLFGLLAIQVYAQNARATESPKAFGVGIELAETSDKRIVINRLFESALKGDIDPNVRKLELDQELLAVHAPEMPENELPRQLPLLGDLKTISHTMNGSLAEKNPGEVVLVFLRHGELLTVRVNRLEYPQPGPCFLEGNYRLKSGSPVSRGLRNFFRPERVVGKIGKDQVELRISSIVDGQGKVQVDLVKNGQAYYNRHDVNLRLDRERSDGSQRIIGFIRGVQVDFKGRDFEFVGTQRCIPPEEDSR